MAIIEITEPRLLFSKSLHLLAGAALIGSANHIAGHNMPMTVTGLMLIIVTTGKAFGHFTLRTETCPLKFDF